MTLFIWVLAGLLALTGCTQDKPAVTTSMEETPQDVHQPHAGETAPQAVVAASDDAVVARVNDVEIKGKQLNRALNTALAQNPHIRNMVSSDEAMGQFTGSVLEQLISTELLFQEGKKFEVADMGDRVEQQYDKLKISFPNEKEFSAALEQEGLDEAGLKAQIRRGIWIENLIDEKVRQGISVSEEDEKTFYDNNKEKFLAQEEDQQTAVPFEEVKEKIGLYLENEAFRKKLESYIGSLETTAKVEVLLK
jgi:hypothetical protein